MSDKPIPCRAKKSEHTGDRIYWCTDPEWIEKLGGPTHEIWPIERSWFCGACGWQPEGVVGATWEELQDHIATCEKHPNSKLRAEIERLREVQENAIKQIVEKDKRIEELEESLAAMDENQGGKHYITTDQIRAAWRDAIFATRPDEEQTEFLEARQLGIVRCECGDGFVIGGEDE